MKPYGHKDFEVPLMNQPGALQQQGAEMLQVPQRGIAFVLKTFWLHGD